MTALEPPFPADDPARAAAVAALGLLDAPRDERFDRITRLAAHLLGTPIAFVSLVSADRWWAVSCFGTEDRELPRELAMCTFALAEQQGLVVPDLREDARFRDNPLVQGPEGLRFYAGMPISGPSGHVLGTLCVADRRPRTPAAEELARLADLAVLAEQEVAAAELPAAIEGRRAAERRLAAVLGSASEAVLVADAEYVVSDANAAACAMLRCLREEVVGRPLHEVVRLVDEPPEDDRRRDALRRLAGAGTGTVEVRTADGGRVTAAFRCTVPERPVGGLVVRFVDAGSRAALDRARDEFVAGTSHELRTPVTSVLGYAELLAERDDLPAGARRHAEAVLRGARRLQALIADLLQAAAAGSAAPEPRIERLDLLDLAADLAADLAPAEGDGPALRLTGEPALVEGDRARLTTALGSLVVNALKFSAGEGTEVRVQVSAADGLATFAVSDDGPGVPAAEVPFLGRRFFRASTAQGRPGTGLGLARAREVAEQHGGRLVVRTALGAGSTFAVELPCVR